MRLLAGVLAVASVLAPTAAALGPDPASVVDGWKTSPVYVDPSQRSLVPDKDADRLAERVRDRDPAIRIAVVPAAPHPAHIVIPTVIPAKSPSICVRMADLPFAPSVTCALRRTVRPKVLRKAHRQTM